MLPVAVISALWGPRNGNILAKHGARSPLCIGGIALTASAAILAQIDVTFPIAWLLIAYALLGLGTSSVGAPITHTAVAGMPHEQAGVAAGVSSTTRQIGQTIGVAVASVVLTSATTHTPRQLATATHPGWVISGGYGLAILIVGLIGTTAYAKHTAERALPSAPTSEPASQRLTPAEDSKAGV